MYVDPQDARPKPTDYFDLNSPKGSIDGDQEREENPEESKGETPSMPGLSDSKKKKKKKVRKKDSSGSLEGISGGQVQLG